MKNFFKLCFITDGEAYYFNIALLFFRVVLSLELIIVHGFKKLGIGVPIAEVVPNPLSLPEVLNQSFATAANIVFPFFIMLGVLTRLSTLPILAVTLTGYFVLHAQDNLLIRDVPFMYSIAYLFILLVGPGKFSVDFLIYKKLIK
ncbi:DoxX family protein [Flavobacterium agrisoli]|uniref:DoxX family protein n=1 Tax=Flavobacterium agrisoli TaxID=2793066 RepID=A0A934UIF1_9FLAO|nr:DoxX family protein [Flavobacterium agrisoli]MBK0368325.1 DoxX family protein [Flavobacterium agrisoli]